MKPIFLTTIALAVAFAAAVSANPILFAPSGTTLGTAQVRAEAAFRTDGDDGRYFWLGAGLMQVEANVIFADRANSSTESHIGLQWNFLPETFATPGVAFGGTDIGSQSEDGIGAYVVATKRLPIDKALPGIREVKGTIGIGIGGIKGPFGGLEVKLPAGFFIQGEYDSRDFNGAIGWQPLKLLRLKAYSLKDDFYLGAEVPPISF